jgi:hypothetical protein
LVVSLDDRVDGLDCADRLWSPTMSKQLLGKLAAVRRVTHPSHLYSRGILEYGLRRPFLV